jgi:glutamate---cysteine ligase / carboxylate-amine ligase
MSVMGTLGVEEELQLLDPRTGSLSPSAPRLLQRLPTGSFSAELQRSTVEMNTTTAQSLDDLRKDIIRLRAELRSVASDFGLDVAAVGMAPDATDEDFELTVRGRFSRMHEEYRLLVDEQLICGYQVHIGVSDPDLAVRLASRVTEILPTLLAISASSPFWRGRDTGYASMRTMIWQRWPTSGAFGQLDTMEQYQKLVENLVATGVISDAKMAYFDVRPSQHVPTLEVRVCDACPLVDDAVLIAGLFRAAVARGAEEDAAGGPPSQRALPVQRAAMWRAARNGLADQLLGWGVSPQPQLAAEVVEELLAVLRPQLESYGDWETVNDLAGAALSRGCSATRQRVRFAERGRMSDVVHQLVEETASQVGPRPRSLRHTQDYPAGLRDEAVTAAGSPTAAYRRVFEAVDAMSHDELKLRSEDIGTLAASHGLTFGVAGDQRPFPLDLIPRIIAAHEWSALAAGLSQRARAIEAFLRDVYGPARIVADGVLDARVIRATPGWQEEARRLPRNAVRAAVIGFDLVREPVSGWRVLEDNVRVPSGVGYAVGIRRVLHAVAPELEMGVSMHVPEETIEVLGRTLRACARGPHMADGHQPVIALISDGAANSAWYEHRILAEGAELLLTEADGVTFESGRPVVAGQPVDVLYLRLEMELVELVDSQGRAVGRGILDAAVRGEVALINAPGNGVADDKSMYCHIPDMIDYYLGESPWIAQVPTYRCADPEELEIVLDRLDQLVTKPVDGYGGGGVLIGADADGSEIDARRGAILADPSRWVAQETISLSTLPTLTGGGFESRHVDLRTFVYLTGTEPDDVELAGLALTRVAPRGSMVVNSSRGGGAKDTWILVDESGEGHGVRPRR